MCVCVCVCVCVYVCRCVSLSLSKDSRLVLIMGTLFIVVSFCQCCGCDITAIVGG